MLREALVTVLVLSATLTAVPPAAADVTGWTVNLPGNAVATGYLALPSDPASATFLVAIFKGVDHTASDHVPYLGEIAGRGQIGFALDYADLDADYAAASAVAAARSLYTTYPNLETGVVVAISGGMPAATLALAGGHSKPAGGPLFDYLLDVEGVASLVETYAEASAAAAVIPAAAPARDEIEAECGKPAAADCLAARSGTFRARDIAASGLRGAWLIHAVNDGLVPYDQGVQFAAALRGAGVPADMTTVLRGHYDDGKDTAATEYATGPLGAPDVDLAGHASEDHRPHTIMTTALNVLFAVFDAAHVPGTNGFDVVDREFALP